MNFKLAHFTTLFIGFVLTAPILRAQDDMLNDPDLKKALKDAEEMQKTGQTAKPEDMKKKMREIEAQAKEEEARQEREEQEEKEKLQAALKKQLAEPGPTALPEWTPATPQFTAEGTPTKKIVDDEVRLVQTGKSPLPPRELLKAWKSGVASKPLNNFSNDVSSNGNVTTRLFVSTRTDPEEKVRLEAHREVDEKITRVEISYCLPKPKIDND